MVDIFTPDKFYLAMVEVGDHTRRRTMQDGKRNLEIWNVHDERFDQRNVLASVISCEEQKYGLFDEPFRHIEIIGRESYPSFEMVFWIIDNLQLDPVKCVIPLARQSHRWSRGEKTIHIIEWKCRSVHPLLDIPIADFFTLPPDEIDGDVCGTRQVEDLATENEGTFVWYRSDDPEVYASTAMEGLFRLYIGSESLKKGPFQTILASSVKDEILPSFQSILTCRWDHWQNNDSILILPDFYEAYEDEIPTFEIRRLPEEFNLPCHGPMPKLKNQSSFEKLKELAEKKARADYDTKRE